MKNNDFEYLNQGKIKRITIQNTRDKGYRFTVTDQRTIRDLYYILSVAKPTDEKTTLTSDYVFEMQETPDKIYKFNYVAGINNRNEGNLYGEGKVYQVSKRLDNDILVSFWNIRSPKNFNQVYYNALTSSIENYSKTLDTSKKVGIDIAGDTEIAKFILSNDVEVFKVKLKEKYSNFEVIEDSNKTYDIIMNVKTEGYKSNLYKNNVIFSDKTLNIEKKYYVKCIYDNLKWTIKLDQDKKPEGF